MRKLLLGVSATALLLGLEATSAMAVTSLTLENPGGTTFQQTENSPCVIGDTSCAQPTGFGEGIIPSGPQAQYDVTSDNYTVLQIMNVIGGLRTFTIGLDVNTTTQPLATEKLDLFSMSVNGVVQALYDPTSPGTQLYTVNNGNGYSDELIKGFDLTGFLATDTVTFRAVVNDATDGREQFFIIGANTGTPRGLPEPASIAVLGLGMTALGMIRHRRRNNA